MKVAIKILIFLSLLLVAGGCSAQSPAKKAQQQGGGPEKPVVVNIELAEKVKQAAKSVRGVEDSTAVVIDDEISTAVKVSGFNRLRLKRIKSEVHRKVKGLDGNYSVHVTSDKKLFSQLRETERQLKEQKIQSLSEIQKKVKKINKDMQG